MIRGQPTLEHLTVYGPTHTRPPIARAHPTQRSYAGTFTGASYDRTSCGSTSQDLIPVGNPRSQVREETRTHTV